MKAKTKKMIQQKIVKYLDDKYGRDRWIRSYPCGRDMDQEVIVLDGGKVWVNVALYSMSLADMLEMQQALGASNFTVSGCGDDFGDSIGRMSWLEFTLEGMKQ